MKRTKLALALITSALVSALVSTLAAADDEVPASIAEAVVGIKAYDAPVFPAQLRATLIRQGYATVAFTIAETGQIDDALTLQASHPAFGEAVLQVLPHWRATPTSAQTYPRREVIQFNFSRSGVVASATHLEAAKAAFPQQEVAGAYQTVPWQQLEIPPRRVTGAMPKVSKALIAQLDANARATPVVVNFVVDTQGQVRVPVVAAATELQVARAVLAAIKQWQYSPPRYHDKPVAVEVSYSFLLSSAAQ